MTTKHQNRTKYKGRYYPNDTFVIDNYTKEQAPYTRLTEVLIWESRLRSAYTSKPIKVFFGDQKRITCLSDVESDPSKYIFYKNNYYAKGYKNVSTTIKKEYKIYNLINLDTSSIQPSPKKMHDLYYNVGIEFETSDGELDDQVINELGIYKLYDGSITGHEYTSIPYDNTTLGNYFDFLDYSSTFTYINKFCSIHINIGVGKYNPRFLIAVYKLYNRLQEEIDLLIPLYKRDFIFLAKKNKDHCKNLPYIPNIDEQKILRVLFKNSNRENIRDSIALTPKYNQNWRYFALNLTKYVDNQKVVEFRVLPSLHSKKYNFLFIYLFQAICKYAELNYDKIVNDRIKIEIEDVLSIYEDSLKEKLISYTRQLKELFFSLKYNRFYDTSDLENLSTIIENDIV